MAKFDSKTNGDSVPDTDYNNLVLAFKNFIESSGQTISSSNLQTAYAAAHYAAVSDFYSDSGTTDAYVLTAVSPFKSPQSLQNGMRIRFRAGNTNTGASTVNVAGLGVKSIKKQDGTTNTSPGDISSLYDCQLRYNSSLGVFILDPSYVQASINHRGFSFLNKRPIIVVGQDLDSGKIQITAGTLQTDDGTGQIRLSSSIVKLPATAWSAGTGNGSLDSGSLSGTQAIYHFLIYNPSSNTTDVLTSLSRTSPTLPSGYTLSAYIGAGIYNASTPQVIPVKQIGNKFLIADGHQQSESLGISSPVTLSFDMPCGSGIEGIFKSRIVNGANYGSITLQSIAYPYLSLDTSTYYLTSSKISTYSSNSSGDTAEQISNIFVNSSAEIEAIFSLSGGDIAQSVTLLGWIDHFGQISSDDWYSA